MIKSTLIIPISGILFNTSGIVNVVIIESPLNPKDYLHVHLCGFVVIYMSSIHFKNLTSQKFDLDSSQIWLNTLTLPLFERAWYFLAIFIHACSITSYNLYVYLSFVYQLDMFEAYSNAKTNSKCTIWIACYL